MKINFDNISSIAHQPKRPSISTGPIKISIESPVYSEVVRELNPHNYEAELGSMNNVINLPVEVSRFIVKEVEKQLREGEKIEKKMSVNFMERTNSSKSTLQYEQKQKATKKIQQQPKLTTKPVQKVPKAKVGWVFNYKKHKCTHTYLPTEARQTLDGVSELTCRPFLYPSKVNKKVNSKRRDQFQNKQYSVYQHLYTQANHRKMKADLNKTIQVERMPDHQPKTNKNFYQTTKNVYNSLYNRINDILNTREAKRKQKQTLDQTSGRQLFVPDTSLSRDSYKLYFHSLSKQKLVAKNKPKPTPPQKHPAPHPIKLTKPKQNPIDTKTIQYFTQIFYSQNQLSPLTPTPTELPIKKQQFLILHPFLHEIQQLQSKKYEMQTTASSAKMSTTPTKIKNVLSKEQFQQKLRKYYQKLSLHDRQILRKQVVSKKRSQLHPEAEEGRRSPFKPTINLRSSSLDNLAKGHTKGIYYV